MSACRKHVGNWYGGPGLWCECGGQECGYCGSLLVAKTDDKKFDNQRLVVIDLDEVVDYLRARPGLNGLGAAEYLDGLDAE